MQISAWYKMKFFLLLASCFMLFYTCLPSKLHALVSVCAKQLAFTRQYERYSAVCYGSKSDSRLTDQPAPQMFSSRLPILFQARQDPMLHACKVRMHCTLDELARTFGRAPAPRTSAPRNGVAIFSSHPAFNHTCQLL
ncbi:hypothetical protein QBC46DRAFT_384705 [Diplogelasinospora grovesii]|uniref:Uncharacterized protein n=1 Tax=Diplogelasinospora grovesii TaxID=303347 RepID=A0AAN6S4Y0_9PEZI|nr:hypothetical protein QBC46DRAFT_384705 [Diplogelasinospora grovesii]